jgi:hypothetical protein
MMKILKSYKIFESLKFYKIYKIYNIFMNFFENFELWKKKLTFFCNLIGRLEMKSRLWLDNVETPNRQ